MSRLVRRCGTLPVLLVVGLGAVACDPAWEDVRAAAQAQVAELQPQIDARRALLEELVVRTLAAPQEGLPPLDLAGRPKLHFGPHGQGDNTLVATTADIRWKKAHEDLPPGTITNFALSKLRLIEAGFPTEFADGTSIEKTRANVREMIERFTGPRYLAIVRTHESRVPKITHLDPKALGSDPKVKSAGSFTPGVFRGDLVLYDLTDKKLLGVAKLQASGSEKIKLAGYDFMADELWKMTRKAVKAAIEPICESPCRW